MKKVSDKKLHMKLPVQKKGEVRTVSAPADGVEVKGSFFDPLKIAFKEVLSRLF